MMNSLQVAHSILSGRLDEYRRAANLFQDMFSFKTTLNSGRNGQRRTGAFGVVIVVAGKGSHGLRGSEEALINSFASDT
jgi:hypothetical protein